MSRLSSYDRVESEALEVIREEQCSPAISSVKMNAPSIKISEGAVKPHVCECHCKLESIPTQEKTDSYEIEQALLEKEATMRQEFEERLSLEIMQMKEKFHFILRNEEIRASHMLQEAHRERQEKITALQAQLECKNLAGLMFVMCAERRKSKLEKLRLIEEYSGYIRALQSILNEGQQLILHLSRGYKTAARVDHEWREKMKKIISEFQAYIIHFGGGTPESNQYLIDLPALLKTEAAIEDNPKEDPIQEDEEEQLFEVESETNKVWFDMLDGECRPFVMFGDMGEFKPDQRRQVLGTVKAAKTAPKYWKEYVFNEMFLKSDCPNADYIKDEYPNRLSQNYKWECIGVQTDMETSRMSLHRRATTNSLRGDMGSILKIITSSLPPPSARATLLAARDSIEIASSTKLRDKFKQSSGKVVLNVGNRKESLFNQLEQLKDEEEICEQTHEPDEEPKQSEPNLKAEEEDVSISIKGSINDSLQFGGHAVDRDSRINYEKVCPMSKCRRMQMDSFMRTLPPYMRASPFTHFEQTYDDYETCSPEQLEILMQRIEEKKKKKTDHPMLETNPLDEWCPEVEGVAVQTSLDSLPPCTCIVPSPTPVSSVGRIFNMADLIPVKQTLDSIRRDCFYDSDIEFDRFKVIGQVSSGNLREDPPENFTRRRLSGIKRILKKHPSLCEIFQANTQC